MDAMASQITSPAIVYSTVNSGADKRKQQRSASLFFVRGIYRWPVNSPHKGPVARKMFPYDDVIIPKKLMSSFVVIDIKFTSHSHCLYSFETQKPNSQLNGIKLFHIQKGWTLQIPIPYK